MNKHIIVQQIIATLAAELDGYVRSAQSAHAEATDDQSKAENKYDTRGLEASYLARGQSQRAAEVMRAIDIFKALPIRDFASDEPIDIGAVVALEAAGERTVYFVGPCAGGTEVELERKPVLVITLQSPVGQQIVGRKRGERLQIRLGGTSASYLVAAVA